MPGINYWEIEEAIVDRLKSESSLEDVSICQEEELQFNRQPTIIVYLERRDANSEQPIANNSRLHHRLRFSIICHQFAIQLKEAQRLRDELVDKVEIALMRAPNSFGRSDVRWSWIAGGEFDVAKDESGRFMSAAEVVLMVEAVAIRD